MSPYQVQGAPIDAGINKQKKNGLIINFIFIKISFTYSRTNVVFIN